jgi:hypothetical protein
MAQTLSVKLDDIERINRMTALAEARRNAILREIDGHREILSRTCVGPCSTSRMISFE